MVYLLYQQDHAARAVALSNADPLVGGSSVVTADPKQAAILPAQASQYDTLCFWGHGDAYGFCGLNSATAFVETAKAWKKKLGKVKTVEIVTCNSRHASEMVSKGQTTTIAPFISQIKTAMKWKMRGITLKSVPIRTGNTTTNTRSILIASHSSSTWCYITGNTEQEMMDAKVLVQAEAKDHNGSLQLAANKLASGADRSTNKFTLNYGHLNMLRRSLLVTV